MLTICSVVDSKQTETCSVLDESHTRKTFSRRFLERKLFCFVSISTSTLSCLFMFLKPSMRISVLRKSNTYILLLFHNKLSHVFGWNVLFIGIRNLFMIIYNIFYPRQRVRLIPIQKAERLKFVSRNFKPY